MDDITDDLMSLALEVTPLPPPRELDMLLTMKRRGMGRAQVGVARTSASSTPPPAR
jgi:hypothetical protein